MARRKRQMMDDDDSDSSQGSDGDMDFDGIDPVAREEHSLWSDPYQRKRRRKNGKEDALYGVFGEDSEDEGFKGKGKGSQEKRSDWTKAPSFVAGDKVDLDKSMDTEAETENIDGENAAESSGDEVEVEELEEADDNSGDEESAEDEPSRPPSPRVRVEEDEEEEMERPRFGGIGSTGSKTEKQSSFSAFTKGGIGSARTAPIAAPTPTVAQVTVEDLPSTFGSARTQRSFVRSGSASASKPATPLPAHEQAHFSKIGGSFGARMLAKMGWQAGTGLGTTGEGIVIPVESKLRPKGMGIAFKGFKEKTEQSKLEARRRGEVVSDDEEVKPRKKKGDQQQKKSDAWKRPKKVKVKVEHKTYEQIVAEAGEEPASSNIGQIIDATGRTPREVASIADISLSSWTPSTDPTRIPEVRHNLRLIADACRIDLDGLAREAKALEERKKWIVQEDVRLKKKVTDEADLIARLQQVTLVVDEINSQAKELASVYEASLDVFSPHFNKLLTQFALEFDRYRLDEIVVAAITPTVRRTIAQWNPLQDPFGLVSTFRSWKQALKVNVVDETPKTQVDIYGARAAPPPILVEKPMTPFESLLWNVWLPKIRTCINNDWETTNPHPAVKLYETWSTFLPPFVRDNMLDQLILPKVHKAVADWNPRRDSVPLQTLVFPWLPHLGLRVEDVMGDARRKVKSLLRSWTAKDEVPKDLGVWREVFGPTDWDNMILKNVIPKLGALLRDEFRINPRNQDMKPLERVISWTNLIRPSIFSQLLESEFFPKWLDVLHIWLIQPKVSFEEVAQWYSFWKGSFPESVQTMPDVARGFTRGLQLMNKAIELGPDAPTKLPRPDLRAEQMAASAAATAKLSTPPVIARPARVQEITFRSIVEDFASLHNLLFMPAGRAHEKSRMPLFRVSSTVGGKGGLLVYIQDDAVWAPDGDEYRAITLEDMVLRANR